MKPNSTYVSASRLAIAFAALLAAAVGGGATLSGCSKDDASAQCNQFLNDYCIKYFTCNPSVTKEACMTGLKKTIDCSKAAEAPSNFDKCPSDITALKCTSSAPTVPDSCDISFRK
jgi:hypothetical protein